MYALHFPRMSRSTGSGLGMGARCVVVLSLLLSLLAARPVSGQMVAHYMTAREPDWGSSRAIAMLVVVAITLPVYVVGLPLLILRRRMYPISTRGFPSLLVTGLSSFVAATIIPLVFVAYPEGPPCAMHVAILWLFMPFTFAIMARCWIVAFRVEIMNFLAELAWRQTQRDELLKMREQHQSLPSLSKPKFDASPSLPSSSVGGSRRMLSVQSTAMLKGGGAPWLTAPSLEITHMHGGGVASVTVSPALSARGLPGATVPNSPGEAGAGAAGRELLLAPPSPKQEGGATYSPSSATHTLVLPLSSSLDTSDSPTAAAAVAASPSPSSPSPSLRILSSPLPDLDPASIPGFFYISRRRWTDPPRVLCVVGAASLTLLVMGVVLALFDEEDASYRDSWLSDRGLPEDPRRNQYLEGAFMESARCFVWSTKLVVFMCISMLCLPLAGWATFRLRQSGQVMQRRARDQAEFAKAQGEFKEHMAALAAAAAAAAGGTATQDLVIRTSSMVRSSPGGLQSSGSSSSSAGAHTSPHQSHSKSSKELDELSAIKREMLLVLIFMCTGAGVFMVLTAVAYEVAHVPTLLVFHVGFVNSILAPLWKSYALSRKHRLLMQRARKTQQQQRQQQRTGAGRLMRTRKRGGLGAGLLEAHIAHHRPWYDLDFLLHDEVALPALMQFLQSEYSSENALFVLEVEKCAAFCLQVERTIPGWRSEETERAELAAWAAAEMAAEQAGTRAPSRSGAIIAPASPLPLGIVVHTQDSSDDDNDGGGDPSRNKVLHGPGRMTPLRRASTFVRSSTFTPNRPPVGGGGAAVPMRQHSPILSPLHTNTHLHDSALNPPRTLSPASAAMQLQDIESPRPPEGSILSQQAGLTVPLSPGVVDMQHYQLSASPPSPSTGHKQQLLRASSRNRSCRAPPSASASREGAGESLTIRVQQHPAHPMGGSTELTMWPSIDVPARSGDNESPQLGGDDSPLPGVVREPSSAKQTGGVAAPVPLRSPLMISGIGVPPTSSTPPPTQAGFKPSPVSHARSAVRGSPSRSRAASAERTAHARFRSSAVSPAATSRRGASASRKSAHGGASASASAPSPAPLSLTEMHTRARRAREWCQRIHADFLAPNAVYLVNLPSELASELKQQMEGLSEREWQLPSALEVERAAKAHLLLSPPPPPPVCLSTLFLSVQASIFDLIEADSFRRFLLTPAFESLLARADEAEVARLEHAPDATEASEAVMQRVDRMIKYAVGAHQQADTARNSKHKRADAYNAQHDEADDTPALRLHLDPADADLPSDAHHVRINDTN